MGNSILFADASEQFLPVARSVSERGYVPIFIPGFIAKLARAQGIRCHDIEEFAPSDFEVRVRNGINHLVDGLSQALPSARDAFSSPMGDFMSRVGDRFVSTLVNTAVSQIEGLEMLESLVRTSPPSLIVLRTENLSWERAILPAARKHGIPSLQIAHALFPEGVVSVAGEYDRGLRSDYIAVFGERAKDIMVNRWGYDPDRILITGAPFWDELYTPEARMDRAAACRELGLDPSRPVVLFCTSYAMGAYGFYPTWCKQLAEAHDALIESMKRIGPDAQLVVRPHPWEIGRARLPEAESHALLESYVGWLAEQGIRNIVISQGSKVPAVRAADIVVVETCSTIIPEVMILERPIAMLPICIDGERPLYTPEDGVAVPEQPGDLPELLAELAGNPKRRAGMVQKQNETLPKLNYLNDGQSMERLLQLIMRLASDGAGSRSTTSRETNKESRMAKKTETTKKVREGCFVHEAGKLSKGAVLDVGLKCAHSCKFCYYSYLDGSDDQFKGMRQAEFRTLDECKEILRLLKQNGFVNFDYTGGEPTLHPDIIEITRYAHQELDLKGRIITLGQFLMKPAKNSKSERLVDDLLEAGLTNFLFSVHAVNEELFHKITGASYKKLDEAMRYLDAKGFHYTSNTTVFEWNYKHLPDIARELLKHNVYLHNFIIMNAYYEWNKDGRAFGVQAKYSDIQPYLKEAIEILESAGVGANIRYAPYCSVQGMEKNLVGVVGVHYDPYEWMNYAGHRGGTPEECATVVPVKEGILPSTLAYQDLPDAQFDNGVVVTGARGNAKYFSDRCVSCRAKGVCDGIDPYYLKSHGPGEFTPSGDIEHAPLQSARLEYTPPFIVKTEQYANMKRIIAGELKEYRESSMKAAKKGRSAELSGPGIPGLTSIILLNLNGATHIRQCVDSIHACTKAPYELIVVDNGSTDDSLDYLRSQPGIKLIENPTNVGAPYGRNQGLAIADGEYIVMMDNDTIVTDGWIERFIQVANSSASFGVIGPMSNFVSGPQLVPNVRYSTFDELLGFARGWSAANAGVMEGAGRLILFCMFTKREVIQKIGGIDPAFGKWGWEDDDFSARALVAGYQLIIAKDIFIHHTGSQTSKTANIDYNALLQENWGVFRKKWNLEWDGVSTPGYNIDQIKGQPFDPKRHCVPTPPRDEIEKLLYKGGGTSARVAACSGLDHKRIGIQSYHEGRASDAIRHLEEAVKQSPVDAEALNFLGLAHNAAGNGKEARAHLRRAIEAEPGIAAPYQNLAVVLARAGRVLEAADKACKAVELDPSNTQAIEVLRDVRTMACALKPAGRKQKRPSANGPTQGEIDARIRRIDAVLQAASDSPSKPQERLPSETSTNANQKTNVEAAKPPAGGKQVKAKAHTNKADRPKLSLCLIVKNEEEFLDNCLKSAEDIADEIVVVDSGSTDRTVEIAKAHGARVYPFEWTDSYADARNKAMDCATGDWVLFLDADEQLDPDSLQLIVDEIKNPRAESYQLLFRNYINGGPDADYVVHYTGRLHRNRPEYRHQGRVHEHVEPSVVAAGGRLGTLDALVHHYGYRPEIIKGRHKDDKYLRLILAEIEDNPDNLYFLIHLGRTYSARHEYELAIPPYRRAAELIQPDHLYAEDIFTGWAGAACMTGKPKEALEAINRGERLGFRCPDLSFSKGNAYLLMGKNREAIAEYEAALAMGHGRKIGDPATSGHKALAGIASAYLALEDFNNALHYAELTLERKPRYTDIHEFLARVHFFLGHYDESEKHYLEWLSAGQIDPMIADCLPELYQQKGLYREAKRLYDALLKAGHETAQIWLKAGDCAESLQEYGEAEDCYKSALKIQHNLVEAHNNLGRIYASQGRAAEAVTCFAKAVDTEPTYANAYFNAGDVLYSMGKFHEAADVYLSGLHHSPKHAPGYLVLGNCCFRLGGYDAAVSAYKEALTIDPNCSDAHANLLMAEEAMAGEQAA